MPGVDARAWRGLIEFRRRLIDKRTAAAKNQLRSLLRGHGLLRPPKGAGGLWTKKGLAWVAALTEAELPGGGGPLVQRDLPLEELSELAAKVRRVEAELAAVARRHPLVAVLMTIPGVGIRTAEAFVAYVDDAKRFGRSLGAGGYFGLVPCQESSAGKERLGHTGHPSQSDGGGVVRADHGRQTRAAEDRPGGRRPQAGGRDAGDDEERRTLAGRGRMTARRKEERQRQRQRQKTATTKE